jgi:hypothetical protein
MGSLSAYADPQHGETGDDGNDETEGCHDPKGTCEVCGASCEIVTISEPTSKVQGLSILLTPVSMARTRRMAPGDWLADIDHSGASTPLA